MPYSSIDALLSGGSTDDEELAAMSQALRGQKLDSSILALSTVKPVSALGQQGIKEVHESAKRGGVLRQAAMREEQRMKEKLSDDTESDRRFGINRRDKINAASLLAQAKAAEEDTVRNNKFSGHKQAWNKEDPTRSIYVANDFSGRPVDMDTGDRITPSEWNFKNPKGGSSMTDMTYRERKGVEELSAMSREQIEANQGFKEEYGSQYMGTLYNKVMNKVAKAAPIFTLGDREEESEWWSNYRRYYEAAVIHDLFGAALTAPELERWKGMSPQEGQNSDKIKAQLEKQARHLKDAIDTKTLIMREQGVSEELIEQTFGHMNSYVYQDDPAPREGSVNARKGDAALTENRRKQAELKKRLGMD